MMELSVSDWPKSSDPSWSTSTTGSTSGGTPSQGGGASSDPRRANKPLMEKRRRARINQSLALLKNILLASTRRATNGKQHKQAKLEKADILEMTVRHFQMARNFEDDEVDKYRAGFTDCVKEVERFLNTPDIHTTTFPELAELDLKIRLLKHLESCILEIESKKNHPEEIDPPSSLISTETNNNFGLKHANIHLNSLFQEQMTKEILKNISIQKHSEKENLFLGSDRSISDYTVNNVKEEPFDDILPMDTSMEDHDVNLNSEPDPDNLDFKENTFQENRLLSMMPAASNQGPFVFLLPANCFEFNNNNATQTNAYQYLMPFLSQLSKNSASDLNVKKFDNLKIEGSRSSKGLLKNKTKITLEELRAQMLRAKDKPSTSNISKNINLDEPLDFSMNSDIKMDDPMWRPW